MKFIMQLPNGSFHVPSAALKISGLEGGDRIEIHTLERAAVIMKQQMNAMELLTTAEALNKLAAELIIHLAKVCGFCEGCETACPYDGLDGGMLELPDYIREEAGIRADAKLCAVVNEDNHTVTLAMAGYSYDLRDVPENILELLSRLDVCSCAAIPRSCNDFPRPSRWRRHQVCCRRRLCSGPAPSIVGQHFGAGHCHRIRCRTGWH